MLNIVIVDDEAIVRHGIKFSVDWEELHASRVEEAFHGQEVLDRWDEWKPDLIITDIKMPVMDGIELIKQAKARSPQCKFIVLSCIDEFEFVKEALMLGASDYMLKMTVRPDDMMACIRRVAKEMEERRLQERQEKPSLPPGGQHYKVESFFQDILTYKYTVPQIVEIAQIYNINSAFAHYSIIVMELNLREALKRFGEDGKRLVGFSAVNMLGEIAEAEGGFDFFKIEHDEYVIVMDREAAETGEIFEERIRRRIGRIAGDVQLYLKIDARFGVSRPAESADRLTAAYWEAKKAADYCLFRPLSEMTVFSRDVMPLQKRKADDSMPHRFAASLFKHLTPALAYGGEEKAAAALQEHFDMLNEQACSPETARACLIKAVAIVNLHVTKNAEPAEPAAARELLDESAFNAEWNLERTKEQLTALCRDYIASIGRRQEKGGRKLIRDIVAYITEHYAEKITLEQTAKHFYVNKTYLSELFKTETGTNFTRRLNDIRLEHAKRLMTHTDMTVTEIAERVGFADFRYFCRVFKNHMGMTPTEFKAKALA